MAAIAGQGVRFEKIGEEPYVVIAPTAHRLARTRKVSWRALAAEPWVLTRKPSLARHFVEDSFRSHGLEPPPALCETDSPATNARLVAEGVGVITPPYSQRTSHAFSLNRIPGANSAKSPYRPARDDRAHMD